MELNIYAKQHLVALKLSLITNDTRATVGITSSRVIFDYQTHQGANLFHFFEKGVTP